MKVRKQTCVGVIAIAGLVLSHSVASAASFGLGDANNFVALTLGSDLVINGENKTEITGDVGVSTKDLDGNTASPAPKLTFNKATVTGDIFLESGLGSISRGPDDIQNGTTYGPGSAIADQELANARAAINDLFTNVINPAGAGTNLGAVDDTDFTIKLVSDGLNAVTLTGLKLKEDTLTIDATMVNDGSVIVNVTGDMLLAKSRIVFNGLDANEVIFNVIGDNKVDLHKEGTVWEGIILAPDSKSILIHDDGVIYTGQIFGGAPDGEFKIYSGADVSHVVPLPAAAWMGLVMFGGLGGTKIIRRRRLAA